MKANGMNQIAMNESSPEKAGVGGSIPSLATMFSNTYRPPKRRIGPNWSQNLNPKLAWTRHPSGPKAEVFVLEEMDKT